MNEAHRAAPSRKPLPPFAAEILRIAHSARPRAPTNTEDMSMKNLIFSLRQICQHNRDGSYKTQADRERMLILIGCWRRVKTEPARRLNNEPGLEAEPARVGCG